MSPPSGHPTQLANLLKPNGDVCAQRHLFCARYDICLDEAVAGNWTSWTCAGCAVFEMYRASASEHLAGAPRRYAAAATPSLAVAHSGGQP